MSSKFKEKKYQKKCNKINNQKSGKYFNSLSNEKNKSKGRISYTVMRKLFFKFKNYFDKIIKFLKYYLKKINDGKLSENVQKILLRERNVVLFVLGIEVKKILTKSLIP